jgi:predicted HAD superfamily Cof-like phosphohydrolase
VEPGKWAYASTAETTYTSRNSAVAAARNHATYIKGGEVKLEIVHTGGPPRLGNPDALADIYATAYERALTVGVSTAEASQAACEEIYRMAQPGLTTRPTMVEHQGIGGALENVAEFQDAAGVHERSAEDPPALIKRVTRGRLLREEYHEVEDAVLDNDVPGVAGELTDLIYVALGSALRWFGRARFARVWNEVHRANMAKRVDGKLLVRDDGKIQKPEGWTPPDLEKAMK